MVTNAHDHTVEFYTSDDSLVGSIRSYLAPAISGGGSAIVIATPAHRRALHQLPWSEGMALAEATREGRYLTFDAETTLGVLMVNGRPDRELFRGIIGSAVEEANERGEVRAFGEMVSVLWGRGQIAAAIELEDLWNELGRSLDFDLMCAYRMSSFVGGGASFDAICDVHSEVRVPRDSSYEPTGRS